ncbi:MAG: bifunctional DNA-formamidopyrimidine glycosylase/DNA-(apurinic or apyrimidinic site) lyase [Myxococcaceae bacterium]|nr:bifunctional DNA-formamidopyrimidine glycosylase/DNA-(apurinic or apyrimidinic site) lyase [Myxococcaceae bacterium]
MPELPEVEIARRQLLRWMNGRRVVKAEPARGVRTFRGADPSAFARISGRLAEAHRRGKYLLLGFDGGMGALMHLGMTGKFVIRPEGVDEPYSRARLHLDDGRVIHFRDPRLFGRIEPAPVAQLHALGTIAALGIDPYADGLSPGQLVAAVGDSKQDLKVALMDQSRIAGLGNIHAAEALFRARIHPARKPASLRADEWRRLARAIRATLDYGIRTQEHEDEMQYVEEPGSPNPFLIYGRAGTPCPRCGTRVRSFTQGGRTTHYCPRCQPKRPRR